MADDDNLPLEPEAGAAGMGGGGGGALVVAPDEDDEPIGYKRPPKATRFPKGKSGNPKGRPRGAIGLGRALRNVLNETVTLTVDGRVRKVTKRELILQGLAAQAIKGKVTAADKLLALEVQAHGFADTRDEARALSDHDRQMLDSFLGRDASASAQTPVDNADDVAAKDRGEGSERS